MNGNRHSAGSGHRRDFLRTTTAGLIGVGLSPFTRLARAGRVAWPPRPRVAILFTEFTYRSHAHVLVENFLNPYLFNGEPTDPDCEVVSVFGDQFPEGDMSREVAHEYGIPIYPTITEALTLGGDSLAVDAVLSIGEHGRYPRNDKGQVEYPRKRFFDDIVATFRACGQTAPVFNDKHLSYRWDWAKEMVDTARAMDFPMMAGSSVPLAQRLPPVATPRGAVIREAVSIHGGPVESYDFHGLEVLQSLIEGRKGGEAGVVGVRFVEGDAIWATADAGLWSPALAKAAMAAELGESQTPIRAMIESGDLGDRDSHGILVDYADGCRAIVLRVGNSGTRWNFACSIDGQEAPLATRFHVGPWDNRNLFKALAHAIQIFFRDREAPYPVQRTLLTTGVLAAAMDSRHAGGRALETPHLAIDYAARDFDVCREMGKSWEILNDQTPQPAGLDRLPTR